MRKIGLMEEVSVTLPAHIWMSFWVAYLATEERNHFVMHVLDAAQREILDPEFIAARDADLAARYEEQERIQQQMEDAAKTVVARYPGMTDAIWPGGDTVISGEGATAVGGQGGRSGPYL
jgi:hypothetical protein